MKKSGFAVAAVAGLATCLSFGAANAAMIPFGDQLSISGNATIGGTTANPTVDFTSTNLSMNNTGAFLAGLTNTAVNAAMIDQGTAISVTSWPTTVAANLTCAGVQTGCMYEVRFGAVRASFDITSVAFTDVGGVLDVSGKGTVNLTGFEPTPGSFLFTFQANGPKAMFSATTTTVAAPGPIVGAGLPGLIAALGGLVALARRRRKQLA